MPFNLAYAISIGISLVSVAIGLTVGSSEALGLSARAIAILGIVSGVLAAAKAFLPAANSQKDTPTDNWSMSRRNRIS